EQLEQAACPLAELPFEALVAATRFANAAAALCVTRVGAAPAIPHRADIDVLLSDSAQFREAAS
ncbi:MAG: hypothetical protein HOH74_25910, partial [Gemmatimonadetes bacterium]|nr:hypothetical protein [Gemmatimonadota bacterium]